MARGYRSAGSTKERRQELCKEMRDKLTEVADDKADKVEIARRLSELLYFSVDPETNSREDLIVSYAVALAKRMI